MIEVAYQVMYVIDGKQADAFPESAQRQGRVLGILKTLTEK